MKAAISGETLGSVMELDEILSLFQKNGIHFIEIWPENIPVKVGKTLLHKRLYANRDVEQAKKILEKYQIKAACVCFGAGFDKELAKDPELFSRELERAVEIAYELGAKVVNHYCYHVAMGPEISFSELEKYYGRAIRKAKQRKIYLALENEAHDITQSPEGMKTIVEHMNSEYFKTNFDATNYYQAGYEGFPYAYDIYYPYASDGAVNIDGLLRRLEKDGYTGFCTMEPHTTPEKCLDFYREETAYLRERGIKE